MKCFRLFAALLCLLMVLGCAACGGQEVITDTASSATTTTTTGAESTEDTSVTEDTQAMPSETQGDETPSSTSATSSATTGNRKTDTTSKPYSTKTSTKTSGKQLITRTTEATTTTTTKDKSKGKSIKVLAIGNSFSVDAMNNHLYQVFESAGYTDITLGNLYIGGCALDTHYDNLKNNTAAYTFYLNTDGTWEQRGNTPAATGIAAAQWDIITIQQVSTDSGRGFTYGNLQKTLDLIKKKAPRAKVLWHMTWAYQQNSDHWAFQYYEKDQMTMYNAIAATVKEQVVPLKDIADIIPAGTAIQNLRTSGLGDTLTSDGHHLKDTYGDYTAALTWFCTITGEDPEAVDYCPGTVSDYWKEIAQSVRNALDTPFAATGCK